MRDFVLIVLGIVLGGGLVWSWPERRTSLPTPEPYTYRYDLETPPPEPWRQGPYGAEAVVVGTEFLVQLANPSRLQLLARTDADYLLDLEGDIKEHGIKEPLVLIIDSMGRVCMKEGHHRTVVATRIGTPGLPVRFEASTGRVAYGKSLSGCLAIFLQSAAREARRT